MRVSSRKERYQKDCLNCGSHVLGRYCQVCGQENIEMSKSAWDLLFHFLADFFHFDGKFFRTVGTLFIRPGRVPFEYREGKRKKYFEPARMYIFTSAIFFIFFFSVVDFRKNTNLLQEKDLRSEVIRQMPPDSLRNLAVRLGLPPDADVNLVSSRADSMRFKWSLILEGRRFQSYQEYDSVLRSGAIKHSRMTRWFIFKQFELKNRYDSLSLAILDLIDHWFHTFPKILFLSLPLFAFLLRLVYWKRRDIYYTDHLVFSTYLHIVFFVLLGLFILINYLGNPLPERIAGIFGNLILAGTLVYEYKAIRNFYKSSRLKSVLNVVLINFLHSLLFILLSALFLIFSIINL